MQLQMVGYYYGSCNLLGVSMNKKMNAKALVLALSLMSVAGVAQAKFVKGMTAQHVSQEVTVWLMAGMSLDTIVKAAHEAGLKSEQVAFSLIQSGQKPAAVVAALIKVDPQAAGAITAAALTMKPAQAAVITTTAISAVPQQRRAIISAALTVSGVNPSDVLSATAAGGGRGESR